MSGLFFGLASLARNAFLISFIPFVIYDIYINYLYKKDWKKIKLWLGPALVRALIFILPFILLWGLYGVQNNSYLSSSELGSGYQHLYPDPYTFLYEKDSYLKSIEGTSNTQFVDYLMFYGHKVNLKNKVLVYWHSLKYYPLELLRLVNIGGAIMVMLAIFGGVYLYRNKKRLLILFGIWFLIWYAILVVLRTNASSHFLEVSFPIFLLASAALYWVFAYISKLEIRPVYKYFAILVILSCLVIHLIDANKWSFHDNYRNSRAETILDLAKEINKANVGANEVIAVDFDAGAPATFNFYTDKSFIHFAPETIKKLLNENKLQWAFDKFGVTRIIGYDPALTERIIGASRVSNIFSLNCSRW